MKNNFTRAIAYGIAALTIPALSQAQSYKITTAAGGSPFSSTLGDGGAAASAFRTGGTACPTFTFMAVHSENRQSKSFP